MGAPKRTWVLCPDDEQEMLKWMGDIKPLIGGTAKGPKKRNSVSQHGTRTYGTEGANKDERITEVAEDSEAGDGSSGGDMKRGWLEKRGEINPAWKNRFFVLKAENTYRDIPKTLWYYKDEESARAGKGGSSIEIDVNTTCSRADPEGAKGCVFEVATPGRAYRLNAPDDNEMMSWMEALSAPPGDDDDIDEKDRTESMTSMASFTVTGPLVEVHSGWMKKKGQGAFGSRRMQKRFFVLYDNQELHYFEGQTNTNIQRKGRIKLSDAIGLVRLKPGDKKDFSFVIKEKGRDWTLDPTSEAQWNEWESKLRPMIKG